MFQQVFFWVDGFVFFGGGEGVHLCSLLVIYFLLFLQINRKEFFLNYIFICDFQIFKFKWI